MTATASPDSRSKMVLRVLILFPFTRTTEGAFGWVPTKKERIGPTARRSRSSGHDYREMGRRSPFLMVDRRGGGTAPYPPQTILQDTLRPHVAACGVGRQGNCTSGSFPRMIVGEGLDAVKGCDEGCSGGRNPRPEAGHATRCDFGAV